ncbi:MAG: cell division protein SepF [Eubacteriaceae bacterium]|nr:cell division protein SepF [Eubacteriaceae bacterium]
MKDNKFDNTESDNKKGKWMDNILGLFGSEIYAETEEDEVTQEEKPKEAVKETVKEKKPAVKPVVKNDPPKADIKKETFKAETKESRYPKAVVEPTNQTKNSGGNMNIYEETSARMRVFTPTKVGEVRDVCDELRKGYAVVVNTDKLSEEDYCRFYDFVYGAAYMIDGKVSQISDTVLILTPATIDISNAVRVEDEEDEEFGEDYSDDIIEEEFEDEFPPIVDDEDLEDIEL